MASSATATPAELARADATWLREHIRTSRGTRPNPRAVATRLRLRGAHLVVTVVRALLATTRSVVRSWGRTTTSAAPVAAPQAPRAKTRHPAAAVSSTSVAAAIAAARRTHATPGRTRVRRLLAGTLIIVAFTHAFIPGAFTTIRQVIADIITPPVVVDATRP